MTMAILGRMWNFAASLEVIRGKQSRPFWHRSLQTVTSKLFYLALIFRRLGGEGCVQVGDNGQNSEVVVLRRAAEFESLVVLSCISRGCQFRATENDTISDNRSLKTYGMLSLFIFLTLYQHLGSKGAKFCVLLSISTNHLNQAECGRYEIQ